MAKLTHATESKIGREMQKNLTQFDIQIHCHSPGVSTKFYHRRYAVFWTVFLGHCAKRVRHHRLNSIGACIYYNVWL